MNKKLFTLLSGVAIITSASLQSCADEFDPAIVTKQDAMANEYAQNFVNRYGTPDPNHTWGMGMINPMGYFSGSTRATEDNVDVRRNQWCERYTSTRKYNDGALINDVKVPGWPNFDGFYYASTGADAKQFICKEADIWASDKASYRPVGDVTDYEIKYVSHWFRTHKNPEKTTIHLSDFFIQNISADADQIEYNNTTWAPNAGVMPTDKGYNGANVEKAADIAPNGPELNAARAAGIDYTVKNITRKKGNYANEGINYAVDQLQFKSIGGSSTIAGDGWTHINNFNAGNSNHNPESKDLTNNRLIMYVHSAGTEDFACKSVMGNDQPWINDWVLVHLKWREPGADGQVRDREGYYLGFDFKCETHDTKVDPDGYYSNWIVKITPGHFAPSNTDRVMCEDLGNTYDFDFNDVVYDVRNDETNHNTVITLQAAGGTLPIWVGIDPTSGGVHVNTDIYEAHSMLGESSSSTPINVSAGTEKGVAIYRIDQVSSLADIGIWVDYKDGKGPQKIPNTAGINGDFGTNGSIYGDPLEHKGTNNAPMRFAVPATVKWMNECKFIENSYPKFKNWVQNQSWKDQTTQKKWYEFTESRQDIHNYGVEENVTPGEIVTPVEEWTTLTPYTGITYDANSIVQLYDYQGDDPIWGDLDEYPNDDKEIAFTYVFTTSAESVEAIMIPVYKKDGESNLYYIDNEGEKLVNASLEKTYRKATKQDVVLADGKNTFVYTFNFSKRQLKSNGSRYCDFILLYVKNAPTDLNIPESYFHY